MKSIILILLLALSFNATTKGQNTNNNTAKAETAESLKVDAVKLAVDAKAKTTEGYDLRKQATAKKLLAIKEKDKIVADGLKNEALQLEQQAKTKLEEANGLRKQALDKTKQATELASQNQPGVVKKPSPNEISLPRSTDKILSAIKGGFVEIFEFPNYRGRSVKFYNNSETKHANFPFPLRDISIKLSNEDKIIVTLREKDSDTIFMTFLASTPSISLHSNELAYLRIGTKLKVEIDFNGVLYRDIKSWPTLHNNDCKKLYGHISYKIYERQSYTKTPLLSPRDNKMYASETMFTILNLRKGTDYVAPFVYSTFEHALIREHDTRRTSDNVYGDKFLRTIADTKNASNVFFVDSLAYHRNNFVFLEVTVNIGSAHKSCNICTDFTWDASMTATKIEEIRLPRAVEYVFDRQLQKRGFLNILQIGPYRTMVRQKKDYTGPEHPTYIQFTAKILD